MLDIKTELTLVVRIQLYWECTNSTLPSIVLESIWKYLRSSTSGLKRLKGLKKEFVATAHFLCVGKESLEIYIDKIKLNSYYSFLRLTLCIFYQVYCIFSGLYIVHCILYIFWFIYCTLYRVNISYVNSDIVLFLYYPADGPHILSTKY